MLVVVVRVVLLLIRVGVGVGVSVSVRKIDLFLFFLAFSSSLWFRFGGNLVFVRLLSLVVRRLVCRLVLAALAALVDASRNTPGYALRSIAFQCNFLWSHFHQIHVRNHLREHIERGKHGNMRVQNIGCKLRKLFSHLFPCWSKLNSSQYCQCYLCWMSRSVWFAKIV